MARMLNGGSGTDGADDAFQPCVERMLFRLMELELEHFGPGFESHLDHFGMCVWRGAIARNWLSA